MKNDQLRANQSCFFFAKSSFFYPDPYFLPHIYFFLYNLFRSIALSSVFSYQQIEKGS